MVNSINSNDTKLFKIKTRAIKMIPVHRLLLVVANSFYLISNNGYSDHIYFKSTVSKDVAGFYFKREMYDVSYHLTHIHLLSWSSLLPKTFSISGLLKGYAT